MALPSEGRLAPPAFSRPVHELPGVLQCRHTGTGARQRSLPYGPLRIQALQRIVCKHSFFKILINVMEY